MTELNEKKIQQENLSKPIVLYQYLFDQVTKIACDLSGKPILRLENDFDETLHVLSYRESCLFIFSTTKLNIAKQDAPMGAYDNSFIFTFDPDSMSLEYTEALPRRQQKIIIHINDEQDAVALRLKLLPYFEKFNLLLAYFNQSVTVKIPA